MRRIIGFCANSAAMAVPPMSFSVSATARPGGRFLFVLQCSLRLRPAFRAGGADASRESVRARRIRPESVSPFQTWDVIANNNNFIIRDVNHEGDPFIIRTLAPNYSLVVDGTGRIGLGVSAPLYQIHHSSGARLDAGSWINASSRAVKQDIHDLDGTAAVDAFKRLQPVTFAYKEKPAETRVGFIAEDVPSLVATADRKGLSAMDIVAVLTKVVQEQQRTIDDLQARLQRVEQKQ